MVKKFKEPDPMDRTLCFKVSLDGNDERQDSAFRRFFFFFFWFGAVKV